MQPILYEPIVGRTFNTSRAQVSSSLYHRDNKRHTITGDIQRRLTVRICARCI